MSSTDSAQWILNQFGRHALLTPDEELTLAREIQAWVEIRDDVGPTPTKDQQRIIRDGRRAFERFFNANLRLVAMIAGKYARRLTHLSLPDLIQEGSLGLIRGIEKFDPSRGYKFSTYGYWWIRQAVTRAIEQQERTIRLPCNMNAALVKLSSFRFDYVSRTGRQPTLAECSEHLGLPTEKLRELATADHVTSLNTRASTQLDEPSELIDIIPDQYIDPLEGGEYVHMYDLVPAAIQALPKQQQEVIQLRFFHRGDQPPTYRDIGKRHGVSRERARQLERMACNAMQFRLSRAAAV